MSLDSFLRAHDDAALVALSNKGLVRRAARDLDKGLAKVVDRGNDRALVEVEGVGVTVSGAGLTPSDCPCPATGLCRHLLTAVMALRDGAGAAEAPPVSARTELLALTEAEIAKFAGADMAAALTLATAEVQIVEEGASIAVTLPDMPAPVQFIAGRRLRDAVFKGPAARKRLATAAAVLALRGRHGIAAPAAMDTGQAEGLEAAFLEQVGATLEQLLVATLRGGASVAMDQAFDLAISARAQAAPRLTGELRTLVAKARLSLDRHVAFEPEGFARAVARTYALVQALIRAPGDPKLLGVLRRDYDAITPVEGVVMGAQSWHAPSGARGMRAFCYDIRGGRWLTAGHARAGGADPSFSPMQAYRVSLFGRDSAADMVGHHIRIPAPQASADLLLAPGTLAEKGARLDLAALQALPALFQSWDALRQDVANRLGQGLRQRGLAQPVLLRPQAIRRQGFDDFAQVFLLQMLDKAKETVVLTIPAKDRAVATWLEEIGGKLRALLCVAQADPDLGAVVFSPVAAMTGDGDRVEICNFSFDALPGSRSLVRSFVRKRAGGMPSVVPRAERLPATCTAVVRHLVDELSMAGSGAGPSPEALDAQGLGVLSAAVARSNARPTIAEVLRTIYLADRTMSQAV